MTEKYYSELVLRSFNPELPKPVTVQEAAHYFNVSTRRIRLLLAEGRLTGWKDGASWQVRYPYQLTIGTRGPHLTYKLKTGNLVRPFVPKKKRNSATKRAPKQKARS